MPRRATVFRAKTAGKTSGRNKRQGVRAKTNSLTRTLPDASNVVIILPLCGNSPASPHTLRSND